MGPGDACRADGDAPARSAHGHSGPGSPLRPSPRHSRGRRRRRPLGPGRSWPVPRTAPLGGGASRRVARPRGRRAGTGAGVPAAGPRARSPARSPPRRAKACRRWISADTWASRPMEGGVSPSGPDEVGAQRLVAHRRRIRSSSATRGEPQRKSGQRVGREPWSWWPWPKERSAYAQDQRRSEQCGLEYPGNTRCGSARCKMRKCGSAAPATLKRGRTVARRTQPHPLGHPGCPCSAPERPPRRRNTAPDWTRATGSPATCTTSDERVGAAARRAARYSTAPRSCSSPTTEVTRPRSRARSAET